MNKFSNNLVIKNLNKARVINISPLEMQVNTKNHKKKYRDK